MIEMAKNEQPSADGVNNSLIELVNQAVADPLVPKFYASNFVIVQSNSDVFIVAQRNGRPEAIVNMSFTSAKTLSSELQKAIRRLEEATEQYILTEQEIQHKVSKQS